MIELVWIRIRDGADPIEVLQRAHDAMGNDGHIIALKPVDDIEAKEDHVEINYEMQGINNIYRKENNEG